MMFDGLEHTLNTAAARLMERGMSRRQMKRLKKLFDKHCLHLPVDLEIMMGEAGIV